MPDDVEFELNESDLDALVDAHEAKQSVADVSASVPPSDDAELYPPIPSSMEQLDADTAEYEAELAKKKKGGGKKKK